MPWGQMWDGVNLDGIPADAREVAGYIDGDYVTYPQVVKRWPHAAHVAITTAQVGDLRADVYDCEQGDGDAQGAAVWVLRKLRAHHASFPVVYTSLSNWGTVIDAIGALRIPRVLYGYWIADWTGHAHLVPGSVATQYGSPLNGTHRAADVSQTTERWPKRPPALRLAVRGH